MDAVGKIFTAAVLLLLMGELQVHPVNVMVVTVIADIGPVNAIVEKLPVCVPALKLIVAVLPVVTGLVVL